MDEVDGSVNYNGDTTNEQVTPAFQVGGAFEQSTIIDGTARAVVYDYTFEITDGTTTYSVAVIDVDLNNDGDLNDEGEDGFYLLFTGAVPPPGTDLTVNGITDNSGSLTHNSLGAVVVCFTPRTMITTPRGDVYIEDLQVGDLVVTADNGLQAIRWIGTKIVSGARLQATPQIRPVCIKKHAFGTNLPYQDTWVSPQHRMLIRSKKALINFGETEIFVPAKGLVNKQSIISDTSAMSTTYIHLLFDRHEVVFANGLKSESFHPGEESLNAIDIPAKKELFEIFPDLQQNPLAYSAAARLSVNVQETRVLMECA